MRNVIVSSMLLVAGCGQVVEEPSSRASEQPIPHRSPGAERAVKNTLLNGRTTESLLAETRANRDYMTSRALSDEVMAESDKETLDKLGLSGDEAATAEEIMREHREARLRVQDLVTALTKAGVKGAELNRVIVESTEMARAKPAYLHERFRSALGPDTLKKFEVARAAVLSPAYEKRARMRAEATSLRAEEGGAR